MLATAKFETIKPSRKPPSCRVFQKYEIEVFAELDHIRSLNDISLSSLETMGIDFSLNCGKAMLTNKKLVNL